MYDDGHLNFHHGYLYVSFVMNLSISYAFYYLVLFYLALGTQLAPYDPGKEDELAPFYCLVSGVIPSRTL